MAEELLLTAKGNVMATLKGTDPTDDRAYLLLVGT
jgi:hypothetical protein